MTDVIDRSCGITTALEGNHLKLQTLSATSNAYHEDFL